MKKDYLFEIMYRFKGMRILIFTALKVAEIAGAILIPYYVGKYKYHGFSYSETWLHGLAMIAVVIGGGAFVASASCFEPVYLNVSQSTVLLKSFFRLQTLPDITNLRLFVYV